MRLLGYFKILVDRMDSDLVPFSILEKETMSVTDISDVYLKGKCGDIVNEELDLFTTEHIVSERDPIKLEPGTIFELHGELWGHYYSYWTDYGTEHDADFEIRNDYFRLLTEEEADKIVNIMQNERAMDDGL